MGLGGWPSSDAWQDHYSWSHPLRFIVAKIVSVLSGIRVIAARNSPQS
jgi:hypothetical protein